MSSKKSSRARENSSTLAKYNVVIIYYTKTAMEKKQKKLYAIAFGDSLTAGFQSPSIGNPRYIETPYADFLSTKLADKVRFAVKGVNGETTDEMARRFHRDVVQDNPDYVLILGGANDIGWGGDVNETVENLTVMYRNALESDIIPVAITIPSIRGFDSLIPPRQYLNDMIQKIASNFKIPCIDMFSASSESKTLRLEGKYSNDGLHLSTAGYRLLADIIYDGVFSKI